VSTLHKVRPDNPGVRRSKPEALSFDSRSDTYLRVARLVSDLHQRYVFDIPGLLREVLECAAELVPGSQYGGATVAQPQRASDTVAATHRYPVMLDEVQNRCQQGPGLAAGAMRESIRVDNLVDDDRWPLYREAALHQTPVRSILSIGMFKEGETTATLSFYAETANAFDDESVDLAAIFATHTGLVWNMVRRDHQFRSALASRDVIGQAKGMMMERLNIDAARAFEMLKLMSQNSNTPLAQVAQSVVAGQV
jgi:GAF domain-containing protein